MFSDASVKAIAAVTYLKVTHEDRHSEGLVMDKAKLAPESELTISHLELYALHYSACCGDVRAPHRRNESKD